MKTGLDALEIVENEIGNAKHENETRRHRHRRKRVRQLKTEKWDTTLSRLSKISPRAQNMKTGPDAVGTDENESESAKHENGT
jgi:hypothetical protein